MNQMWESVPVRELPTIPEFDYYNADDEDEDRGKYFTKSLPKSKSFIKIVFCSPNFLIYYDGKFFYCDFSFSPSYRSRQKGTEGKFFEAEAAGRG